MKPLLVLIIVFLLAITGIRLVGGYYDYYFAGKIAMCAMLVLTAIGHFSFIKGMMMMIPDYVPAKRALVLLTGIFEIAAGICLLIPSLVISAGWSLIVFFVLIIPANINAAIKHVDFQHATYDGPGPVYLWFRLPLQVFFILWVYLFALHSFV